MEYLPAKNNTCQYCGVTLDPAYYFCPACATPFQAIERVLPEEKPAWESAETIVRKRAPQAMTVFWTFALTLFVGTIASALTFGDEETQGSLILVSVLIFVMTCVLSVVYWEALKVQLARFGFNHIEAWIGLGILPVMLLINYAYHRLMIAPMMGEDSALDAFDEIFTARWSAVLIICVLPAITEEIAFRGMVQHWMHAVLPDWKAIGLAAGLFSLMHVSIVSAPYLFALGVLLGYTRWKTGSLYPAMLIHFLHNFVVLTYF